MDIIETLKNKSDLLHGKGVSKQEINDAESELDLQFSDSYIKYLAEFGSAGYSGHELSGLLGAKWTNVVELTKREKDYNSLVPKDFYVIEYTGIDGIVIWQSQNGKIYITQDISAPELLCNSFEEYVDGQYKNQTNV